MSYPEYWTHTVYFCLSGNMMKYLKPGQSDCITVGSFKYMSD